MSRHRNVRSMRYSDEYDGYDDEYGHSVEDDYCISPSDAAFMYDRSNQQQQQLSSYVRTEEDIAEEDEALPQDNFQNNLSELEKAKLMSCLDEIRNVLGDTLPEKTIIEAVTNAKFDVAVALNWLLNTSHTEKKDQAIESPKPQRTNVRPRGRGLNFFNALGGRMRNNLKKQLPIDEIKERTSVENNNSYFDVIKFLECDKKNAELNLFNALIIGKESSNSKVDPTAGEKTSNNLFSSDLESFQLKEEKENMFVLRNMTVDELKKVGPSMFGYFVCKRLIEFNSHCNLLTENSKPSKSKIPPFDFKSQSPDDIGLCNRRWRQ